MKHVVVADILPARLEEALKVGADAVISSKDEDVIARLIGLHGPGDSMWPNKAGADVFLDAAGVRRPSTRRSPVPSGEPNSASWLSTGAHRHRLHEPDEQ